MKSAIEYLAEARNDIITAKTEDELSFKMTLWAKKIGKDTVTFFPNILSNKEGQKWLMEVADGIKKIFTEQIDIIE